MATTSFHHLGDIFSIMPGVTHHWKWNNAATERVWTFSVDAYVPLMLAFPGAETRLEVLKTEYRQNYDGDRFEHEIHFWVKNVGTMRADYYIHMAVVRE
ncbi:MAG: hypothetical protein ACF8PN_04825 [Phycisphaerales bacterium]